MIKFRVKSIVTFAMVMVCAVYYAGKIYAQSDIQFTQYWTVPSYYNPAAAGDVDYIRIRGGARLQWVGIDHAPKSFMGTVDMPLRIGRSRIGVGTNVMQESIGLFSNLLANLQANYKLKVGAGYFSIGLQGGYFSTKFKGSEVSIPDDDGFHTPSDENIPTRDVTGTAFDLSAGIWYAHKYFSLGLSGLHLLSPKVSLSEEGADETAGSRFETELRRQVYFMANSNIPIKNTLFEIQPSMMIKTDFATFTAELTARARYNRFLSVGVGYRHKDAVSFMAAAEFRNFFIGYSYDYPVSAISKASSGSHEIIAGYCVKLDFGDKNKHRHRSIRIM